MRLPCLARSASLLAAVLGLATFATGCTSVFGCDGNSSDVDTQPVSLTQATATASEVPACNGSRFAGGYALSVTEASDGGAAPVLSLALAPTVTAGQSTPLTVAAAAAGSDVQMADAPDGSVSLAYTANADLDATPVAAALVTVGAWPSGAGDPLVVMVEIHFLDGRVLTDSFSAATTANGECPAD